MKKCLAFLFVFLILLPFCGCAERTYELSWDGFCYVPGEPYEQPLELDPKDKNDIIDILNSATWYGDLAKCPADFIFVTQKQRIHYNCESGVFNDITRGKSTTLSEEDRAKINSILKSATADSEK